MSFNPFGRLPNLGGSQTPKLPQYETYQKNLEVASKSEHDIQELKKASAFGEAPNKILGGSQQKFGRLPIKFWEAPKKFLRGSKIFRNPIFFFFSSLGTVYKKIIIYFWLTMTRTHYVLLKAFVVTRNLRHWEAKSEQLTRSDKNHSQIQVTQSLFLTLRCLAQNGICFLKAFVETRNLYTGKQNRSNWQKSLSN